ncbi:MAG: GNAT family N-acetyltransferase [Gammaproteobacteria bacterium]|jgi:ribosomal protein S18 acetylase RimI-like enzyme|nr:GNAT family N-acetyltransferase [Gammaproteobacteria bacterium]
MPDETLLRPATATDARDIAELIAISSDGVALIDWSESAAERQGVTPIDVGAEAYARDDDECSYRNCVVAERDGAVLGVLLTFPMQRRETPAAPPPYDGSDIYAPYKYLEAPDTWYVCGVALYPEHRGQGIGGRFMALAESQARERGFDRVSLVAFEENVGSVRLYRRLGYAEVARAPVVPHPLIHVAGDALLMVKALQV